MAGAVRMLAVDELSFAYRRGGEAVLHGLSYSFETGAITGVTGASGCGKSTLLYLVGLLLKPSAGRVLLDGNAVHGLADVERSRVRARRVGFVFQDAALDTSRTVLEAVVEPALYAGSPRRAAVRRAGELLHGLGVAVRADHRPGEISGGQAQRVALCRALMNDPAVILADEPTGNLDRENTEIVLSVLQRAARAGRTVVLATHDPFVMSHADRRLAL